MLCPGPVPTEFQARAGITSEPIPPLLTRSAEQVARAGYRGLKAGRRVVVPGFANKAVTLLAAHGAARRCCSRRRIAIKGTASAGTVPGTEPGLQPRAALMPAPQRMSLAKLLCAGH